MRVELGLGLGLGLRLGFRVVTFEGIVPLGMSALVLGAGEVPLTSRGSVLELLVAVIAVVLAQWHLPACVLLLREE